MKVGKVEIFKELKTKQLLIKNASLLKNQKRLESIKYCYKREGNKK